MASSSDEGLDESIPEMVYQCINLVDTHTYKREDSYLKCLLCNQYKKQFYCVGCIRNGNITHSRTNCFERFADKKPKKYRLDEEKNNILKKYEAILSRKAKVENVRLDIERSKEKIKLLEDGIKLCKAEMSKDKKLIEEVKEKKQRSIKRQRVFSEKLSSHAKSLEKVNDDIEIKNSTLTFKRSALEFLSRKRLKELVTHIFPIAKVPSSFYKDSISTEGQKKADLQEAQTFTYVKGNWTYDNPCDNVYSIVEPYLTTGDFSAYTFWKEKMGLPDTATILTHDDVDPYNPVNVANAALAYEAQLVYTITNLVDCQVPKRSCFNDFCNYESFEKFSHCVAKLNANVLNLCIARQVDLTKLHPDGTMSNLLALIHSEKSKVEKSEEQEDLIKVLEDSISPHLLPKANNSDDDNSDDLEAEFVHVSDEDVPDYIPSPVPEPVPIHTSLLSSLWKKATGQ